MRLITLLAALLMTASAFAQHPSPPWPEANYDPAVPTMESVLGHKPGERISWHHETRSYFEALAKAAPERLAMHRYADSWEGRELFYVVISSAKNMANIDSIKAGMQQLRNADDIDRAEASEIIDSQPAVTWLSYGVHGNEISSTDASMMTAYHLLASRGDERVDQIMSDTVVVIDPMQNPDGRDRFIHHFEMAEGLVPSADRFSAEHNEPWPGGRTNHYLFDMNRDWFMLTQPESRGRVEAIQQWYPVAFVDAHEMGSDQTYYFSPEAIPYNPHIAADQRSSLKLFGQTNARWFDHYGRDYYTREDYDAFYPGYGASWPSYFGSIAMTYEQASARGLLIRQYDGNVMTYADTVFNHFLTSLGTAETVAQNRQKFLQDFHDYQRSAIAEGGSEEIRAYVLPAQADQAGANKLAGLLVAQGVDVGVATQRFSACGQSFGAGSYVINLAQPAKRLVRSLLDPQIDMEATFLAEQERRRAKGIDHQMYDVTAWSLPLMMNVASVACARTPSVETRPATGVLQQPGAVSAGPAQVAYLVPWGEVTAVRFLALALRQGIRLKSTDLAFTHQGTRYPSGTLIVDVADNEPSLHATVSTLATSSGARVVAVNDSWVSDGPNFGSGNVVRHNLPRVAMAWDSPTDSNSAGNMRFVIEQQFGFPVVAIRSQHLPRIDLHDFDVLILPEESSFGGGNYAQTFGKSGIASVKQWVEKGGVLIAIGSATRFVADANIDLIAIRRENAATESDEEGKPKAGAKPGKDKADEKKEATVAGTFLTSAEELESAIAAEDKAPDSMGGVLAYADVDPDHWMSAGVAQRLTVLVEGSDIYTPIRLDSGVNVARFGAADELLASGYIWEENRRQLAYKPFAVAQAQGRGFVIAFTQNPNKRAYMDGLNVIFANAIFRGAAHARPLH